MAIEVERFGTVRCDYPNPDICFDREGEVHEAVVDRGSERRLGQTW